jgi:CRP/FNR family transcriptional regulator, cyclic AMP receptor protein
MYSPFGMMVNSDSSLQDRLEHLGPATIFAVDVFEVMRQGTLFEEFSRPEVETLCQYMECYAAHRGVAVITEGEAGDYLLIVLTGSVTVRKRGPNGSMVDLDIAGPGKILGEMSLIDGKYRSATCTTAEPSDFAVMTRASLNRLMVMHQRLACKFLIQMLEIMVSRQRTAGDRLVEIHSALAT